MKVMLIGLAMTLSATVAGAAENPTGPLLHTARIEELTGAKGKLDEKEGVFKVSAPRSDLSVTVAGVHLTPPMGLTSWAAFKQVGRHTTVMGDLVLLEDQVNPVMSAALDESTLASAVGKVFAKIRDTSGGKGESPHTDLDPAKPSLDPAKIEAILHEKGELNAGVYKVVVGRATQVHSADMGNAMGVNTWAAFVGSDDQAVVDGDFAMLESEVQGVLKALRGAGINIVAIHQHMTGETPRIIFLHYWGVGPTELLARGLRAALDKTSVSRVAR